MSLDESAAQERAPQPDTNGWETYDTQEAGYSVVTCHSIFIEGVLCRWWGDGPEPPGVKLIDSLLREREASAPKAELPANVRPHEHIWASDGTYCDYLDEDTKEICSAVNPSAAPTERLSSPGEDAKRVGRIIQEEITALLAEHGFKHNKGHRTAEVVANMVQMAIDKDAQARESRLEEQLASMTAGAQVWQDKYFDLKDELSEAKARRVRDLASMRKTNQELADVLDATRAELRLRRERPEGVSEAKPRSRSTEGS